MKAGTPSPFSASRAILIGRLVLLLAAVAATVAAFAVSRTDDGARRGSGGRYRCPMHPEVTAAAAADCPICHMALEIGGETKHDASSAVTDAAKRRVFTKDARGAAWVRADGAIEAVLYKDDLLGLVPDEAGLFFTSAAPTVGLRVRRLPDPVTPGDGPTAKVLFGADLRAPSLRTGEVGWVTLTARARALLVVPANAVLSSSTGPYVLAVATDGGGFIKRPLDVGKSLYGVTVVLSGLADGERVAVGDAFFWDAERRLQAARGDTRAVIP